MSIVVETLSTTSDKIRALILEGYLRTEVAQFLGIRYQHVRRVLVDAGMKEGMQRGFATAPKTRQKRQPRTETTVEVLIDGGFTKLGNWIADQNGGIALAVPAPRDPGVYAFVVVGVVKYIGLTRTGFHKRMANYRAGNVRQRTSHRINKIIIEHVALERSSKYFLQLHRRSNGMVCQ